MPVTNTDFSIALTAIRTQARLHGLDLENESNEMNHFLSHMAELLAQAHAETRDAMNIIHKQIEIK